MLTHVAIKIPGETLSLPAPNRHHNIISAYYCRTGQPLPDDNEQGFLDDTGRFLNRKQALYHAQLNEQVKPGAIIRYGMLFSEDVW